MQLSEGRFANLKVFDDAGDPYGEVLSFLRHGDVIECTDYVVFAGQSWIQHLVDESKQGLYKGEEPKPPYTAWSPEDIAGFRWLHPVDEAES